MQLTELKKLYEHLETGACGYIYYHNIADLFLKIRDLEHEAGHTDIA